MAQPAQAAALVAVAVAGQLLTTGLAIVLARRLAVADFEAYVVASAVFVMLATFAPRGAEKHVLRTVPAMLAAGQRARANALVRFGARRTLLTAIAAALVIAGLTALARAPSDETRLAIIVTCLSLPAGAAVHFGIEALTAAGRPVAALALTKLFVPGLALTLSLVFLGAGVVRGAAPIGAWGLAWLAASVVVAAALHRAGLLSPGSPALAPDHAAWRAETRPFFAYRVSLALLAQASVVALDLLQASAAAVGAYAAALAIAGTAGMLATATNRAYGRELALLLDRRDFAALYALRRQRLRWLVPALAGFLAVTLLFPGPVLTLFRPEFASEGTAALRLLAVATAFSVLFALAPTYLKYRGRNRTTYTVVGAAAAAPQGVLLGAGVPRMGATGAALAYASSMGGMYAAFALIGHRELARLRAGWASGSG